MVSSNAPSVKDYLASLPPDRRRVIAAVRDLVHKNLPRGYEEGMLYGMISWYVPLSRFPNTYNGQPLTVVALAAQKNHASIYLMAVYGEPAFAAEFEAAWADAGKRLNMGKSCVRFKELDDLAVDVLADAIRRVTPEVFIARYEAVRGSARNQRKAAIEGSGAASTSSARASKTSASKTAASKKSASKTAASKTSASKKTASKATASKTAASKATASKTAASKATASKATSSKSASSKSRRARRPRARRPRASP
ncbi:MAG: DUF1801 domain-containing protein [Nannocystaceae bacterium]